MSNKETYKKIIESLTTGHLKQALNTLATIITPDSEWELHSRFNQIQSAYNYMLEYLRTDKPDPNRENLYKELIGQALIICDETAQMNDTSESGKNFMQYKKEYNNNPDATTLHKKFADYTSYASIIDTLPENDIKTDTYKNHEQLLKEAFHRLRTTTNWKSHACDEIYSMLTSNDTPTNDATTLVTAITLGLLNCFEPQKAILLCRLSMHKKGEIAIRALTGLLLALLMHEERIEYYPQLQFAIDSLCDDKKMKRRILTAQILLLRTRETQKIDKKMREEIIPSMMKNPNIYKGDANIKFDFDDVDSNPEWNKLKKWADEENIQEKINKITQWHDEGADIYLTTFSQLKKFPFFDEMQNWVRPFDKSHPAVSSIATPEKTAGKSLLNALSKSYTFCNSDKYSFCFTLLSMNNRQLEAMAMQIPEITDEEDIANDKTQITEEQAIENIGNQYIQDLYRLIKISRNGKEHPDPFLHPLNLLESKHLAHFIQETDSIVHLFNYLVEKEYYIEAAHAGRILEKAKYSNAQFYQKMGYCMQRQGDYRQATDYYTKADIVMPDSLWTLRRMAQCYRALSEYDNALHYYTAALQMKPEDKKLLLQTGECLAMLKRYDEAFTYFFKVEYMEPDSLRTWRVIAWCSFLTGNYKQARHYYRKLVESKKAEADDIMNAAHLEWVDKNHETAYELYKAAEKAFGSSKKLLAMIDKDSAILMEHGVSEFEITLLKDLFY